MTTVTTTTTTAIVVFLLHLFLPFSSAILFDIPVSLDNKKLPPIEYAGGNDPAVVVAQYMLSNSIQPDQALVNSLNNRVIQELQRLASDTVGKEELFTVPFKLGTDMLEMVVYDSMPVLLLASNFCVQQIQTLDEHALTVAECCETVLLLTNDLHDQILLGMKKAAAEKKNEL